MPRINKNIAIYNILNNEFISRDQYTVLSIQKELNKTKLLNQYVYYKMYMLVDKCPSH